MFLNQDIIIIGGGISGLYAAYKIKKQNPSIIVTVLEKQSKKYAGGRTGNHMFRGSSVVTGAGVGRKKKDYLLLELLCDLGIKTSEFPSSHHYSSGIKSKCDVKKTFFEIKRAYHSGIKKTFKEFAISVIGEERYRDFVICSGYSDYENEDAHSTLFNYGFDDNYSDWIAIGIPWDALIQKLISEIGAKNVIFGCGVEKIKERSNGEFDVICESHVFSTKKVIVATTIEPILRILPSSVDKSIYKQIHGQPFLRTYGQFSEKSKKIMEKYVPSFTVVSGPLQKLIPMNQEKGIYMISYADNRCARLIHKYGKNTTENREHFCRLIETALGLEKAILELTAIEDYYWPIGTHYYEPLSSEFKTRNQFIKKAQHPCHNILVVGEMISKNQGWVEGALESVEGVLTSEWIKS